MQAMDPSLDSSPPSDWYKSSIKLKPAIPPSFTNPVPLHVEHAIFLTLPHLLHIPNELNINPKITYSAHNIELHYATTIELQKVTQD